MVVPKKKLTISKLCIIFELRSLIIMYHYNQKFIINDTAGCSISYGDTNFAKAHPVLLF